MKMLLISYAVCFLLFFSVAFICGRMCSKNMSEYYAWKLFPLLMDKDKDYIATVGGARRIQEGLNLSLEDGPFFQRQSIK